ncbi:dTDP-4-amino-4,6-dideoxygalactose transaminase [Chitinophaga ginsengisegetis]|uniref:dTDP-4-amino-4,6-dideoxygalactose transaminase n=1 Tax=Chitinophaga ginsengisegetis TaxID=393003 RepID=A0A1T5PBF0_9BACT|nr:DegT/DnrJ/EryC1/StrS family aminotransferase [Chitinophaga ginsengisegetis]SKD10006.1 dTDP-4-amino-4,6-dideoxygalactose transaminase [Chitinophaga ginsengisegetis]
MSSQKYSRRAFIRKNGLGGLGLLAASSLLSNTIIDCTNIKGRPAILDGSAIRKGKTWPDWPIWNPETDSSRIDAVLKSGVWSRATVVSEFEKKWAETVGARRCVTVVNGTNALTVALNQLGVTVGDEVLVPPYTFIGTIVAIINNGAMPVFVDTNRETFQIDVSKIEAKITSRTKAILPVHVLGLPADMNAIMTIARKHNLFVIEDACQAPLAEINNQQVGTFGNAGCYSFQNSKNLPVGEGGAIVSNNENFIDRCYSYHNFGYPYGSVTGAPDAGALRQGNKLRWTEYQAAIGLAQLVRFQEQTNLRNTNAAYLRSKIESLPGIIPYKLSPGVTRPTFHLFAFRYQKEAFGGLSRTGFINALNAEGIPASAGYTPLNTQPYLSEVFQSSLYKKVYPKKMLNIQSYNSNNHCPENDILCNEEAVWLFQNLLLGNRSDMDDIAAAIEKTHANAEQIKKSIG